MSLSHSTNDAPHAKEYLESIQRQIYSELGLAVPNSQLTMSSGEILHYLGTNPQYSESDTQYHAAEIARESNAAHATRPEIATYGTPELSLRILERRIDELKIAGDTTASDVFPKIAFGIVPGGGLDAWSEKVPNRDEFVICVPDGLLSLVNLVCKLVIMLLPVRKNSRGLFFPPTATIEQFHRSMNPYWKFRRRDMLFAYFLQGDPYAAQPYKSALPFQDDFSYLLVGTELFVLAHEMGHIALGHFDYRISSKSAANRELEADAFALKILNKHFEGKCGHPALAAMVCADVFLSLNRLWETTIARAFPSALPNSALSSHPGCEDRIEGLMAQLTEQANSSGGGSYLHVHNAVCFAAEPISDEEAHGLFPSDKEDWLLSARVLPEQLRHYGHFRPPRDDVWFVTIAKLLTSGSSEDQRLGLWFFVQSSPACGMKFYLGLDGEDSSIKDLYHRALIFVEPLYERYLPRLMELFREAARREELTSYVRRLAGFLIAIAQERLGEARATMDPMHPGFF